MTAADDQMDEDTRNEYLRDNGYDSIEEWARDSDYEERDGLWYRDTGGDPVTLEGCLDGAIDSMRDAEAITRYGAPGPGYNEQ